MKFTSFALLGGLTGIAAAKFLATTTRYYDGQEGACGCGTSSGPFSWQLGISTQIYTAAGSQALFDTNGGTWCGGGCGKCYNLTATGPSACSTCGTGETAGASIIVMVTNLCPNNGNEQWCPSVGGTNEYGYSYHFDIMAQSEVFGDNPVVEFEPVACPGQAASDFDQCVCNGQLATDVTPVGMSVPDGSSSDTSTADPTTSSTAGADPPASSDLPASAPPTTLATITKPTVSSSVAADPTSVDPELASQTHSPAPTTSPESDGPSCPAPKIVTVWV